MAFEEGTSLLTCPDCGTQYKLKWSRMPVKELQTIYCEACVLGVVYRGNTLRDHFSIKRVAY